ncbi:MAG: hypothetical protein AAF195_03290 [Pseudomonadota bacterium]
MVDDEQEFQPRKKPRKEGKSFAEREKALRELLSKEPDPRFSLNGDILACGMDVEYPAQQSGLPNAIIQGSDGPAR